MITLQNALYSLEKSSWLHLENKKLKLSMGGKSEGGESMGDSGE